MSELTNDHIEIILTTLADYEYALSYYDGVPNAMREIQAVRDAIAAVRAIQATPAEGMITLSENAYNRKIAGVFDWAIASIYKRENYAYFAYYFGELAAGREPLSLDAWTERPQEESEEKTLTIFGLLPEQIRADLDLVLFWCEHYGRAAEQEAVYRLVDFLEQVKTK